MASMTFTVHTAAPITVPVPAKAGDRDVIAHVPGLLVELVNEEHGHTLRFTPANDEQMAELVALFQHGAHVVAHYSREG